MLKIATIALFTAGAALAVASSADAKGGGGHRGHGGHMGHHGHTFASGSTGVAAASFVPSNLECFSELRRIQGVVRQVRVCADPYR
jgi:hypothetical protein